MKDEWEIDIVAPLFSADLDFFELIHDWDTIPFKDREEITTLRFQDSLELTIPTGLIFEPATIIDSFTFLINGNYNLTSVDLEYTISNGCPFPLNFQMRFFNEDNTVPGATVLPSSFIAAEAKDQDFSPVISKDTIHLDDEQLLGFKSSNRIEFSTWFDHSDLINERAAFEADYPVSISIILFGKVEDEDDK